MVTCSYHFLSTFPYLLKKKKIRKIPSKVVFLYFSVGSNPPSYIKHALWCLNAFIYEGCHPKSGQTAPKKTSQLFWNLWSEISVLNKYTVWNFNRKYKHIHCIAICTWYVYLVKTGFVSNYEKTVTTLEQW